MNVPFDLRRLAFARRLMPIFVSGLLLCTPLVLGYALQAQHGTEDVKELSSTYGDPAFDVLQKDKRLGVKVSLTLPRLTLIQALHELSRQSGVPLATSSAIETTLVGVRFETVSLRSALFSIALPLHLRWTKTANQVLLLTSAQDKGFLDAFRPRNAAQAERDKLGRQFIDQVNKLPQDQQDALTNGEGVQGNALPSNMQAMLSGMLSQAPDTGLSPDNVLSDTIMCVPSQGTSVVNSYMIIIKQTGADGNTIGHGFPVALINNPQEDYHVVPDPNLSAPWNVDNAQSRNRALKNDPRLMKRVSLSLKSATFIQALQQLASLVPFDFVCANPDKAAEPQGGKPITRSFVFANLTLKEALQRLQKIYQFKLSQNDCRYEWSQTPSGIFTFHEMAVETAEKLSSSLAMPTNAHP